MTFLFGWKNKKKKYFCLPSDVRKRKNFSDKCIKSVLTIVDIRTWNQKNIFFVIIRLSLFDWKKMIIINLLLVPIKKKIVKIDGRWNQVSGCKELVINENLLVSVEGGEEREGRGDQKTTTTITTSFSLLNYVPKKKKNLFFLNFKYMLRCNPKKKKGG